jgi:hypothetical protein
MPGHGWVAMSQPCTCHPASHLKGRRSKSLMSISSGIVSAVATGAVPGTGGSGQQGGNWPSTTGNPSGRGRGNAPLSK